jgi:hypothetical protein
MPVTLGYPGVYIQEIDLEALLTRAPGTRVLTVQASGERAFLYELRPQRVGLGEASADRLLEAIRQGRSAGD